MLITNNSSFHDPPAPTSDCILLVQKFLISEFIITPEADLKLFIKVKDLRFANVCFFKNKFERKQLKCLSVGEWLRKHWCNGIYNDGIVFSNKKEGTIFFLIYLFYLFIFGCVGSLLLCTGFL